MYIICLAGPGGVGKSTTAKALVKSFNKLFPELKIENMAFADPIYELASNLLGIPVELLKSQEYKEVVWTKETSPMPSLIGWTPRKFLQIVGTEGFRNNVANDFWVEVTIRKAQIKNLDFVVMEDARFSNEYDKSSLTIELKRDNIQYKCNHASAMPPDPKYISFILELIKDINYDTIVLKIVKTLEDIKCGM